MNDLRKQIEKLKKENQILKSRLQANATNENNTEPGCERSQLAVESSTDGVWDWNITTNSVYYSPQYKEILGFTDSEFPNTYDAWAQRVHPDDIEDLEKESQLHMDGQTKIYIHEHRMRHKDGHYLWIRDAGKVVEWDDKGKPVRFVGTHREITHQKTLEYQLRERIKELKYHKLLAELLGRSDYDIDKVLQEAVDALPFSYQFPEITVACITIGDKEYKSKGFKHLKRKQEAGIVFDQDRVGSIEVCLLRKPEAGNADFLEEEMDLLKTIASRLTNFLDRDLKSHQLVESQMRYKNMVERIADVIFEIDEKGMVRYISPAVKTVLGYDPGQIIGLPFTVFTGDASDKLLSRFEELKDKKHSWAEYQINNMEGQPRWLRVSTTVHTDGDSFKGMQGTVTDITEIKEAEQKTKQNEELFMSVMSASPDTIALTDMAGHILLVSQAAFEMFGLENSVDAIGSPILKFVDDSEHEKAMEAISLMHQGIFQGASEYKGKRVDGSLFDVEINGEFIRDEQGMPIHMVFVIRDITERKKAEAETIKSEQRYKSLFHDSPDAYLIIKDGRFIDCNHAAEDILGGHRDDIVDKKPDDLSPKMQPNGMESSVLAERLIKKAMTEGKQHFDWVHLRLDGSEIFVRVTLAVIQQEGTDRLLVTWRDITRERETMERIRILTEAIEQSPVSVLITDPDGKIEYANAMTCKTTGYDFDELYGNNPRIFQSGESPSDPYDVMWSNLMAGNVWHGEFRNKRKNGEVYWESATIAPVKNEDGKITRFVALKQDVTTRKAMEEALVTNEQRFQQMAVLSQTMIWEVDMNGVYTYLSPVSSDLSGYAPEELVGKKHFYDLHPASGRKEFKKAGLDLIRNQYAIRELPNQIERKDGQVIWVSTNGVPVYDEKGIRIGYRGADVDVTEKRIAEEELLKFKTVTDRASHGAVIVNLDGIFIYVNESWASMHGYSVDELMGKHVTVCHTQEQAEIVGPLLAVGDIMAEEVWHKRKDDSVFPTLMNGTIIRDDSGIPQYLSATAVDISELKKAEEEVVLSERELRYAQEIAHMGSWDLDLETGETNWSDNYYRLMGLHPGQDIDVNGYFMKVLHPDDHHLIAEKMEEIQKTKSPVSLEMRLKLENGQLMYVRNNIVPVIKDGKVVKLKGVNIDITPLKLTSELLNEQNERLNAIVRAMPDLIFMYDREGVCHEYFASNTSTGLLGRTVDMVGSKLSEFFDKSLTALHLKNIERCLSEEGLVTYNYQFNLPSGIAYFEARLVPVGNERVLAFVRDITQRRKDEMEIKKLSLAVVQSPVVVVITDTKGNVEYANPAFSHTSGYALEEVIGQSTRLLKSGKNDDRIYEDLWKTITKGKTWRNEWINKKKSGEFYWENVTITPIFDDAGKIINYLAVKEDITEKKQAENEIMELNSNLEKRIVTRTAELDAAIGSLKQEIQDRIVSEEKFAKAFRSSSALMSICELDSGKFTDVNNTFLSRLGYHREDIIGNSNNNLQIFGEQEVRPQIIGNLNEGKTVRDWEVGLQTKEHKPLTALLSAELITVDNVKSLLLVMVDITERKIMEESLKAARNEAEEANRAKSDFLANMSHEIRTPMNAILGYSELLASRVKEKTQKDFLNSIKSSGRSLLTLINDILDLSKIEAGKLELEFDYMETNAFFKEFEHIFSFSLQKKGLQYVTDIASGTPTYLYVDEARLRQILLNLLGNAVKFTHEGQITLSVITHNPRTIDYTPNRKEEVVDVEIRVIDTGMGIPQEYQEHIFESFAQVRGQNSKGGTGLGLPISRRLAMLMNGDINLKSTMGKGSTFCITLPDIPFVRSVKSKSNIPSVDPASIVFKPAKVLVVDDIQENSRYINDSLSDTNLEVFEVSSGDAALMFCKETLPDLIISDIRMPEMDGFELLERLKSNPTTKHIPVVAYSASVMKEQKERIFKSEFADLLIKPVQLSELYHALMKLLPHEVLVSDTSQNDSVSDKEDIVGITELLELMEGELTVRHQGFATRQPKNEIVQFGQDLIDLGNKHQSKQLSNYGKAYVEASENFDIEGILDLLNQYPDMITHIKNQKHD